jgi:hypothetical protein
MRAGSDGCPLIFRLKSPKNTTILTLTLKRFSQPSLPFLIDNFTENLIN